MASVTVRNRFITVLGPVKEEIIVVDTDASSVDNPDTSVDTNLQNPIAASAEKVNADLSGTADGVSVEMTAGDKDLTIHDVDTSSRYVIRVLGF